MYLSTVAEIPSSRSLHTIIAFSEAWKELSGIILSFEDVVKKAFKLFSIDQFTPLLTQVWDSCSWNCQIVVIFIFITTSHNYWTQIAWATFRCLYLFLLLKQTNVLYVVTEQVYMHTILWLRSVRSVYSRKDPELLAYQNLPLLSSAWVSKPIWTPLEPSAVVSGLCPNILSIAPK